ncbi:MAG: hypothetical protein RL095_466 [Verrucomicrobiota bacterium]|jgi:hypothetical protein
MLNSNTIQGNTGIAIIGDNNIINNLTSTGLKERIKKAIINDRSVSEFLEDLSLYMQPKSESSTIGLEEKFIQANMPIYYIEHALECKELFAKILHRNINSLSFQKIISILIDESISKFTNDIYPIIESGASPEEVKSQVNKIIIDYFYENTTDSEMLNRRTLEGLIFLYYWELLFEVEAQMIMFNKVCDLYHTAFRCATHMNHLGLDSIPAKYLLSVDFIFCFPQYNNLSKSYKDCYRFSGTKRAHAYLLEKSHYGAYRLLMAKSIISFDGDNIIRSNNFSSIITNDEKFLEFYSDVMSLDQHELLSKTKLFEDAYE